jgi:hypothetical protein
VSDVIVSDILDSDHLPIIFHILDVKIRNLSEPTEKISALLEAVDSKPPERIRPCDLQKQINSLTG